jgi:hypothetical protein
LRKKSVDWQSRAGDGFDEAITSLLSLSGGSGASGSGDNPSTGLRFDRAELIQFSLSGIGIGSDRGRSAQTSSTKPADLPGKMLRASLAANATPAVTSSILSNVTVVEGGSAAIARPGPQSVTFTGTTGTLTIDHSVGFTGAITGLAGDDALDLVDVNYRATTTASFLGNTTGGTLTVSDGVHTASLALNGNYLSSSWTLSSDGNGGTIVVDPVASNAWQTLKIGAGGLLSGIDVAPDGTMVVRTDTYGAYIWNGTEWQQLVTSTSMPAAFATANANAGQGVYEIRIAPSNTNILYMTFEGYIFRSTNKGATWTQTNFAHVTADPNVNDRGTGQKMAIDPNNPNVVYVGTMQNGLFVTNDGGVTWQNVSAVPVSQVNPGNGEYPGITGIVFDPAFGGVTGGKTNTIFASSYGNGVYESTNAGASWSKLNGGPSSVGYAAVSPTGVYYAVGDGNSLWSYTNGTWTQLLLITNGQGIQSVAVNPFNPNEIVAQSGAGYLNVSYDAGTTWSGIDWSSIQLSATDVPWLATTPGFMSIAGTVFDPLVPGKLWASAGVGVWNTTVPQNLQWTTPITWNSQSAGIEQLVANEIVVAPGGHPVLASWDRPFFYVSDPTQYPSNYLAPHAGSFAAGWSVDYASSNPNVLVGIADWWGNEESGYSTDGGQTWQLFPTMPSFAGTTMGGTIAASSPTDIVWAPADGLAPQYTKDGGLTWHPVVLPGVTDWSTFDFAYYLDKRTVTADRVLPDTFYLYYVSTSDINSDGVYRSSDGGATWTKVFNGQISDWSYYSTRIEAVPGEAGNLFFTGGQQAVATHPAGEPFYLSTDGGTSWTAVPNVLEVSTFGFGAPATPGGYPSIYIVGYVNSVYGIWQSNDDAHSWVQIGDYPQGSLDTIKTIAGDPNIYGQVYVGFQGSGYAYLPAASAASSVNQSVPTATGMPTSAMTLTYPASQPASTLAGVTSSAETEASLSSLPSIRLRATSNTIVASPASGAVGPSNRSSLGLSFHTSTIGASVYGATSRRDFMDQRIALLCQYTAAGFQVRDDAGALASHMTAANGSTASQMLSVPQAIEKFGRQNI